MSADHLNDPATQRRFAYERGTSYPSHTARVRASRNQPMLGGFGDNDHQPSPIPPKLHLVEPPPVPAAPLPELATGEKGKARDLLAAIRTLKTVEAEHRPPTDDEMQALRRFGGFGAVALSIFPDPVSGKVKDGWQPLVDELKGLLTPEEYDSARRTIFTAFYTAPTVMEAMHAALARLGVPDEAVILEPGCAVGRFMDGAKPGHRFIGVELDGLSGRIARQLHPKADIRVENFRDSKLPALDGVIGNVPFADIKLDFKGQRLSLHDYFIAKSVDSLKPGGVLALVTSHYTMDKLNAAAREAIAAQADLVGAIRLPSDAFKREGTAVVTDIVFLRKRAPGQEPAGQAWHDTTPLEVDGATVAVNRYFLNHPEMVLGTWSRKDTLYGGEGYSVLSNGDLASQLKEAIARLPAVEKTELERANPPPETHQRQAETHQLSARNTPPFRPPPPLRHLTEGSLYVGDDRVIRQIEDGQGQPVNYCGVLLRADGTPQARKITALIGLRDDARRVLQSQNEGWPEEHREAARRQLNRAYDAFVAKHGPINKTTITKTKAEGQIRRMPNLVKFREDPDSMLVMSLEEYDETTDTAAKAAIMRQDVVGPKPDITRVTSAEEGLLVSLDRRGGIDLGFIAGLYGKPEGEIVQELGDLIYRDPETREWQTADAYLSGNVREKLKVAEAVGPDYARNATALRSVQPEDVLPGDIDANLGAPWIPATDIRDFAAELFGVPPEAFRIGHLAKDAVWSVEPSYQAIQSVAATADYGTSRINGTELLSLALNLRTPMIYDAVMEGGKETRVINPVETAAAREKQKAIKERFKAWVFSDPDRTERLVRGYNDAFNNLRPRLFDGSHLDFPGMSKAIELRPHQKDAVWRAMTGGNTLLAHSVGAGKTNVCVAAAMKMKQAGLIKKPLIACPNHMLEQFSREWMQLYPNAKILIASKEDFTKERRKALTAKIATGDWDGIIVTHSSFERIGMSKEFQERFLREQIADYEALLVDKATSGRNIVKQLEKQKAAREEKLKNLLAEEKKDDGLVFDDLGVDQIFVDECFTYDTLVDTDIGPLKIGEIVRKMLPVKVKSVNPTTQVVEWKPVIRWFANKRRHQLVEVVHEEGSVRCTTHHKLFTGFVTHRKAGEIEAGETLLVLQKTLPPHQHVFSQEVAKVLLGGVSHQRQDAYGDLRVMQDGVQLPHARRGQFGEETAPVLLGKLQDESSTSKSRLRSEVQNRDAANLGQSLLEGQKEHSPVGTQERKQIVRRDTSQGLGGFEGDQPQAARSRRKRLPDRTADPDRGADGHGDGACDPHQTHSAPDGQSGLPLQSGPGRSGADAGGRVGREQPSLAEGSGAGRQEGQSLITSRVVGVTLLEPDGDGEYRFGGRDHSVVFDIEVADNHNYFANGVLVSNCHAYKNLETPTKMDRVAGIQTGGSERAFDLLMKSRYLDGKHPGHGLIGASGTPISNSMVEMYTNQRFFDPKGLEDRGIEHFDAWAASFGEVVDAMEISPDGSSLRPRSRFAKFINLPELVQMFRAFADVQTADMLDLPRPSLQGGKAQTVACPMSDEQAEFQQALIKRYDRIRSERVDPREDNALAITTDGRKLALDGRMLGPSADHPGSKINALAANVARIWEQTTPSRGTQLVFCDMGVNPTPWGFSAYDEVTRKLVERGIPRNQIADIGDADTDAKKQALFEKVRQGTVRVLLGSTQKMGTGTNVQKRLIALHHLDAPWKPAEVEQREGRILRQGNQNKEVAIFRYVTEGSFDAFMWQALETKARFIAQVMSGDCVVRKAEDIGGQELSYAEVKAIASGNPAVLTLAETDAELQRLAILHKNHRDEQYLARRNLRDLPGEIARLQERLGHLETDRANAEAHKDDPLVIGERSVPRDDVAIVLGKRLNEIPAEVDKTRRFPLGRERGLEFGVILHHLGGTEVYVEGEATRKTALAKDNPGARAVLNAVERLMWKAGDEIEGYEADIRLREGQLRDYEARAGTSFAHGEYQGQLTDLRDELKLGLSDWASEEAKGKVDELAERIRELRDGNAVEAAPERTGARPTVRAERPVTARIRERSSEVVAEKPEQVAETPTAEVIALPVAVVGEKPQEVQSDGISLTTKVERPSGHGQQVAHWRLGQGQMRLF